MADTTKPFHAPDVAQQPVTMWGAIYLVWLAAFQWGAKNPGYAIGAMLGTMALLVSVLLTVVIVGGRDAVQTVVSQAVRESSVTIQASSDTVSDSIKQLNETVKILTTELQAHRNVITSLQTSLNSLSAKVDTLEQQIGPQRPQTQPK